MKNRILASVIALFAVAALFGSAYASWAYAAPVDAVASVGVEVPSWTFGDVGYAKIGNVGNLSYLTATEERTITRGSPEAVRFTNTAGTQTKDHIFNINLDREYALSEIATCKIEFDYYHAFKREQSDRGFPKLQLFSGTTARGSAQGGGDTLTEISPYVATDLDGDWWHLEYYVTSLCPTMADHQDTPIPLTYRISCIRFTDRAVYDYGTTTAFMVLDNLVFANEPGARLGLFNRTTSFSVGTYYWFKVAWSGVLHSCVITCSDPTVAEQDVESTKSPFYIKGLKKGTVVVTATLEIGSDHRIFSVSNSVVVK